MSENYVYSYFRISKSNSIHESAQKYRDLRLRGLQASPGSFSSTYEIESAFTDADWIERLTIPGREVFICAATPSGQTAASDAAVWVGQVTIRGPASRDDFTLPIESGQPSPGSDEEEERWQMLSLFVLPEHQGRGLGGKLCQETLNYLRNYQSSPPTVNVRLIVKAGNNITVNLYHRLGFVDVGRATLAEALIANGDAHLLPTDTTRPEYFTVRGGIIMTRRMNRV